MKKNVLLLCCLFASLGAAAQDVYTSSGRPVGAARKKAQSNQSGWNPDKLIYGSDLSLGFGSGYNGGSSFLIGASPVLGYRITDHFMAGIGAGYTYQSSSRGLYNPQTKQATAARYHWLAPNVWVRYGVTESIYLQAEYAYNVLSYNFLQYDPSGSGNVITSRASAAASSLLLGGGLRQRISDRSSLLLGIYYNVLGKDNQEFNPYPGNLVIRTGISIGY